MHPGFGVYVHIPFCAKKCDYCAFATFTDREKLIEQYLTALRTHIRRSVTNSMPLATSVFIGGGTPTLVPAEELMGVLSEIPLAGGAEVTVECNPDDISTEMMNVFRRGGVNRVSIGVQSSVEHVLRALGRTHKPENVRRSVDCVREAGIENFNLDIIYGAAGETLHDWRETLDAVVGLNPTHVSAYGLTVEPNTVLATQPERHPDDDDQADKYLLCDEIMTANNLLNYEISNWAMPGRECEHNSLYWRQGNYEGFGSAAHAHLNGRRWWNVRKPERYIELVNAGESPESASETLDAQTRKREALQLLVRTREGVPLGSFSEADLDEMSELIQRRDDKIVLTIDGRLLANEVALRLIDAV